MAASTPSIFRLDGCTRATTGYWGKGPELLDHRLTLYSAEQRMVFGANTTSGIRADAGLEHRGVRSA